MKVNKIHIDDFGRSPKISLKIIESLKYNKINSISVLIGFVDLKFHKMLMKRKIKTKLHLNLTDYKNYEFNKNKVDTSFLRLLFLKKKNRKYIFHEIEKQIKEYKKIYSLDEISLDGHEHIHFIPWIYKHLIKNKKYNIRELRYPNEKFNLPTFKVFKNIKLYRNLFAWILLKFFSLFNERKTKNDFFGILYSSIYNKQIINHQLNILSLNNKEILLHLGKTHISEKKFFSKKYFNYYSSDRDFKNFNS